MVLLMPDQGETEAGNFNDYYLFVYFSDWVLLSQADIKLTILLPQFHGYW